ncbi:MAG: HIT domain-containing protein [Candidatus Rokubacteria bacterium]|nr:HIT domain-containing protein [Candidatus Rokubacteria bacterium]
MTYITAAGVPSSPCIFCDALTSGDDRRALVLRKRPLAFLILNAFPYATGHLMAVPTRHVARFEEVEAAEMAETMGLTQAAVRALQSLYTPDGFNLGMNLGRPAGAGVLGHLHLHVVPRWNGDTNFMPVVAQTKVIPEALDVTYDRLTAALDV